MRESGHLAPQSCSSNSLGARGGGASSGAKLDLGEPASASCPLLFYSLFLLPSFSPPGASDIYVNLSCGLRYCYRAECNRLNGERLEAADLLGTPSHPAAVACYSGLGLALPAGFEPDASRLGSERTRPLVRQASRSEEMVAKSCSPPSSLHWDRAPALARPGCWGAGF